jgi:Phage XkdN-like protein.
MEQRDFKAFMNSGKAKTETHKYPASKRFVDEKGEPILWEIEVLTSKEFDQILNSCKTKTMDKQTRQTFEKTDAMKLREKTLVRCVRFPDLSNSELQDSYGVVGEMDLLLAMLTPGEFTDLYDAVMQAQGFEAGMSEKIEEAKN